MKNVLVDMNVLKRSEFSGLYQFSMYLGKALVANNADDVALNFYVPKQKVYCFGKNVNYRTHHSFDKFYLNKTKQYDVWHTTNQISWYKPFNHKTKIILTLHDINFVIEEPEKVERNNRLLKELQKRIDRSDYIVGISQFALQHAQQFLNFNNKPTSVIYNAATTQPIVNNASLQLKVERPFLLSIGSVQTRKNFHVLSSLLINNDYDLIIAGENHFDYAKKVRDVAKKLGVANRVKLIGAITDIEKHWYLQHCTAFLFPSIAEGFGIPVLEAMQYGKPVFLSTHTSLPEIGGAVAYYFNSFDEVEMQHNFEQGMDNYNQTQPQQKIIERANWFSWDKAALQYLELYKNL